MANAEMDAIVEALHVYPQYSVKVSFASILGGSDMRHAGIIYQDMHTTKFKELTEGFGHLLLVGYVATVRGSLASCRGKLLCNDLGTISV